jgi:hypothetical protein
LILVQFGKERGLLESQRLIRRRSSSDSVSMMPVGADVEQFVVALDEDAANEQAAMAVGGVFFAAHQGHAKLRHAALQALNAVLKSRIAGALAVENPALGVVIIVAAWDGRPALRRGRGI